jgi:hypothetical protein
MITSPTGVTIYEISREITDANSINLLSSYIESQDNSGLYGSYKVNFYTLKENFISSLSSSISNDISNEISLRISNETSLSSLISSSISNESSLRISNETSLSSLISSSTSSESSLRIIADESLSTLLSTEISDRISYDTYIISLSGSTVIGEAEQGGYTDGIFTDFTPTTRLGIAIDRFNEMFKLLAPTPPSEIWTTSITSVQITSPLYNARALTTGVSVNNITTDTTPSYTITDTVGTGVAARSRNNVTFTMKDNGTILETVTITTSSENKTSGIIQYTIADPYAGISGEAGFWTGVTAFNAGGTLSTITPSASARLLEFEHPISTTRTYTYYVDNTPSTPNVTFNQGSPIFPPMTRYVSGVPSLSIGQTITSIGFSLGNVITYFYNQSLFDITGGQITNVSAQPPTTIPTTFGQTVVETGKSVTISGGYSDTNFVFTVNTRSANGSSGNISWTESTRRIDTVSNESGRLTSGSGSYPSTGWGNVWGTNSGVSLTSIGNEELQMKNGIYQYPTVNYSSLGGPDYSIISGIRWVTLNVGTFSNNSSFTLNFVTPVGITNSPQANLLVQIKINGQTSWVDGDAAYSGTGNPGSGGDGVAACTIFTTSSRRITFGSLVYSGSIIARVGINSNAVSFTNLTSSSIS